ncbi:HAMP domain-containing protein [Qipengyuania sp. YG27]|uniref:histidine kinase n=1 Tax=Qipengyuania mesophila TaxID=2867246 RepID=A0ABS7JX91_9SPHN|nr:ATP-binding protein [Qipengyuania mesophila]MBX7502158.1 HAMP domain-containing protein [Qipengyuania mesophila]
MGNASFWRSGAFRTAMLSGVLFVGMTVVLLALVYQVATSTIEHQISASVEARARTLEQALEEDDDVEELSHIVPAQEELFRYVENAEGKALIADLVPRQHLMGADVLSADQVLHHFVEGERLDDSGIIGFGMQSRNGGYVYVAQEDEQVSELREALLQAGLVATGLAILLSFLLGWWIALRTFRRIEGLNSVAANVMGGDMAQRMPVSARRDEIDLLSAQLNRMLAQLESVMGAIRQVTNDIAHDMRTPLGRLQRKLEQAQVKDDPDAVNALVSSALDESRTMLDMFGSMLRIAQIEGGGLQKHFVRFDLSAMLMDLAETYRPAIADGGRELVANIQSGIEVFGDRALVQQMFSNLVDNAAVHTPRGTIVRVTLERRGNDWMAKVADTGPGIDPEHRPQIFDRFYRADASRTTRGSGLGLALVKAVAEAHEWDISIANGGGLALEIRPVK